MRTSIQEMQWVLRAQCSDREALEMLLRSVQPSLRQYLSVLVGRTDADDLLQDVMVIVIRKLGGLDDPQVFRPWAFRIASREAFRHIKKRHLWIGRHEDDSQLDDLPTPEIRPSGEHDRVDARRRHSDDGHDKADPSRHRARVEEVTDARHWRANVRWAAWARTSGSGSGST